MKGFIFITFAVVAEHDEPQIHVAEQSLGHFVGVVDDGLAFVADVPPQFGGFQGRHPCLTNAVT